MNIIMTKVGNHFIPSYDEDYQKASKITNGESINFKTTEIRNPILHRKFFKMIDVVYQNLPEELESFFNNKTQLRSTLLDEAGYVEEYITFDGEKKTRVQSLAYEKMDEITFRQLYEDIIQVISRKVLPGIDSIEFKKQIEEFL